MEFKQIPLVALLLFFLGGAMISYAAVPIIFHTTGIVTTVARDDARDDTFFVQPINFGVLVEGDSVARTITLSSLSNSYDYIVRIESFALMQPPYTLVMRNSTSQIIFADGVVVKHGTSVQVELVLSASAGAPLYDNYQFDITFVGEQLP